MKIRLQKYLSQKGICSRREAEGLIRDGKIKINSKIAELGDRVDKSDEIEVYGKIITLTNEDNIYIILNKPIGYTCTKRSFKDEKNIYELLPSKFRHLNTVGRLDKDSEGLLILTNDGDYIYKMTHPKFEIEKEYLVQVDKKIDKNILDTLKRGVDIGKDKQKEIVSAKKIKQIGDKSFEIVIAQGKNRQIRRMCGMVGLRVVKLKRIREGNIELSDLGIGKWVKINITT